MLNRRGFLRRMALWVATAPVAKAAVVDALAKYEAVEVVDVTGKWVESMHVANTQYIHNLSQGDALTRIAWSKQLHEETANRLFFQQRGMVTD